MAVRIRHLSPGRVRGMIWRKRVLYAALRRTGLWWLMDRASAPGKRIEVTRHRVAAPLREPFTVALLADLHLPAPEGLAKRMLALVAAAHPDLILLAGDLTSLEGDDGTYLDVLSRLSAPRGVWMVPGNWDYWAPMVDAPSVYEQAGVRMLRNAAAEIAPGVWLVGLDDAVAGTPDPDAAFGDVPPGAWTMAFFHCPVSFPDVAGRCALALAGHTHGGQVRLPGLPPLWLPAGSWPYVSGWYERSGSRMYVSRGLETPGIPVRMFCRPEITLFAIGGAGGRAREIGDRAERAWPEPSAARTSQSAASSLAASEQRPHSAPLVREQAALEVEPPGEAAQRAVSAQHAVAGNEDADRIGPERGAHEPRLRGDTERGRDLPVGRRGAEGDAVQALPHRVVELRGVHIEGTLVANRLALRIAAQGLGGRPRVADGVPAAGQLMRRRRIRPRPFGRSGWQRPDGAQAPAGRLHREIAEGGGDVHARQLRSVLGPLHADLLSRDAAVRRLGAAP